MQGPVYLRFGRLAVPVFHDAATYHFEIGKGEKVTDGSDIAIIATGLEVNEARIAAGHLAEQGIGARVINIHTIKPLDEEIILEAARDCRRVITCEEHSVIGGLGEAVCSLLSEKLPTPVRRVGIQDKFACSGPAVGPDPRLWPGRRHHRKDRPRNAGLLITAKKSRCFSVSKTTRFRGNLFLPAAQVRNPFPLISPFWTKFSAEPRTRRKAARTLSVLNFPVCVLSIPHMSAGQDFFDSLKEAAAFGQRLFCVLVHLWEAYSRLCL